MIPSQDLLCKHRDAAISLVLLDIQPALDNPGTSRATKLALDALETGTVYRDEWGDLYCESRTQPGVVYRVWNGECPCPAVTPCWHRFAVRALVLFESYVTLLATMEEEIDQDSPTEDLPPLAMPEPIPVSPFPGQRYRRDAGKLIPRALTIREEQAKLGAHLQRVLYGRPQSAILH